MQVGNRQLLVLGDRLLVRPDNPEERTKVGLYLPQGVGEKEPVQAGRVVETGPGIAIPNFAADGGAEPWEQRREIPPVRYIPVQADIGDYVMFLRKESIEVHCLGETFLVIPQSAVLVLLRGDDA